eukprot:747395-Amphidinium_carterae.1
MQLPLQTFQLEGRQVCRGRQGTRSKGARLPELRRKRQLPVQSIRYTQDSIARRFRNGDSLESAIQQLQCGQTDVSDYPIIEVYLRGEQVFCLDNRRLYVFKQFAKRNEEARMMVPVQWVDPLPQGHPKFTTSNAGTGSDVRWFARITVAEGQPAVVA